MSNNRMTFIGYLATDPEIRRVGEKELVSIKLACNSWAKDKVNKDGTPRYETIWVQATYNTNFRDGKMAATLKKGAYVALAGRGELQMYMKKDGKPGASIEIQFPDFLEAPLQNDAKDTAEAPSGAGQLPF